MPLRLPTSAASGTALGQQLEHWLEQLRLRPDELGSAAPTVSHWSIRDHADHIQQATDHNLRAARRLIEDADFGKRARGGAIAMLVLRSGRIPRGRAQSPEVVQPRNDTSLEELLDAFSRLRDTCQRLVPEIAHWDAGDRRCEHPALGPLSAREWLRFAVVHSQHHLNIVQEIRTELVADEGTT